jgi:hypothetical protein
MNDEYKEQELIVTATYSVKESKGSALGLEGNQALYIVGGVFISFLCMFYGMIADWSVSTLTVTIIMPPVVSYIYVLIFFKNKSPGYQKALLHGLILGSDDDIEREQCTRNPYYKPIRESREYNK